MIKRAKTIEFEYQDVEGEKHTLILEEWVLELFNMS